MQSVSWWEGASGKGGNGGREGARAQPCPQLPLSPGAQAQGGSPRAELPGAGPAAQLPGPAGNPLATLGCPALEWKLVKLNN